MGISGMRAKLEQWEAERALRPRPMPDDFNPRLTEQPSTDADDAVVVFHGYAVRDSDASVVPISLGFRNDGSGVNYLRLKEALKQAVWQAMECARLGIDLEARR